MAKKAKRKKVRMDALKASKNPRVRAELLDYDYLKQLSKKDLEWLAKFTDEYTHASIEKDKKGNVKKRHLHKTKKLAKSCMDRNNWRNNDVYSVTRANGLSYDIDSFIDSKDGWYITNPEYTEQSLIEQLDSKQQEETISLLDFFKARDNFIPSRREELDNYFMKTLNLTEDSYFFLLYVHDSKISTKVKIESMSKNPSELEKFIKKSKFFKG